MQIPPGQTLEAWNQAHTKVENYLAALRLKNKFLLGQHVQSVLHAAMVRASQEPDKAPSELATEEAVKMINNWVGKVLAQDVADTPHRISTQGRLAMMLADVTGKYQEVFLTPGPWPEDFVKTMRESYLRAGPNFQISHMEPRPLDLGPIHTLTTLNKRPYFKMILAWLFLLGALVLLFIRLH
jgi:hypothetical protein